MQIFFLIMEGLATKSLKMDNLLLNLNFPLNLKTFYMTDLNS